MMIMEPYPDGSEDKTQSQTIYIGGHPDKELANHAMGSFEMYMLNRAEYLPDDMAKLLVANILKRVDEDYGDTVMTIY